MINKNNLEKILSVIVFSALIMSGWAMPASAKPDDSTPMAELKAKCDAGDVDYCVGLANAYMQGIWLPKKPAKALKMFETYCKQKNMKACRKAGIAYFMGEGTKKDLQKALFYSVKACDGLDASGCNNAGTFYKKPAGSTANPEKSKAFYIKSCSLGDVQACKRSKSSSPYLIDLSAIKIKCKSIQSCLKAGRKSFKRHELKSTLANFKKACELQSGEGCYELAERISKGAKYQIKEIKLAAKYYEEGCVLKHSDACVSLAMLYLDGHFIQINERRGLKLLASQCDKDVPNMRACAKASYRHYSDYDATFRNKNEFRDYAKAAKFGRIACFANAYPGFYTCDILGEIYATGGYGLDADPVKATNAYLQGCSLANYGEASTCDKAGKRILRGEGAPKNAAQAISLFKSGCKVENSNACYELAIAYERGIDTPKKLAKAVVLYKQNCNPADNTRRTTAVTCAAVASAYEGENQFTRADKINSGLCKSFNFYSPEDYDAPANSCVAVMAANAVHQCDLAGGNNCAGVWDKTIASHKN